VVGVDSYCGELYESLPAGGVIVRFGVGFDGLDLGRATVAGILCTNTPRVLDQSVAEHTMALIASAARNVCGKEPFAPGTELAGKSLAVIGCGGIGCRVANIASRGFEMHVVGCEVRNVDAGELKRKHGFAEITASFEAAVEGAAFVSLHLPLLDSTCGFVDARRLESMPRTAWLVNTARGALVDELALFEALAGGRLRGAALDVTTREPYEPVAHDADLRSLPNVIMTPHVGSSTTEACGRMAGRALRNLLLRESGQYAEMDLLNPAVLESIGGEDAA